MAIEIDVQFATTFKPVPNETQVKLWAMTALRGRKEAQLTVRLVDESESRQLNARYRGKDTPTNVLSFPAELPSGIDIPLLGDIVVCAPLVDREAGEQNKKKNAHWAHIVIHGVLHLLGHDHQEEDEAGEMETIESDLLFSLGFPDPYR